VFICVYRGFAFTLATFWSRRAPTISCNPREIYFYPAHLKGHTEREYHPGR